MVSLTDLPRVEQVSFEGQSAWVKRPEQTRANRFVFLHKLLQRCLPKVLHHTGALGGMDAIRDEARRLREFKAAGLPVPDVLALSEGSITLSHAGGQLRSFLRALPNKADCAPYLSRAVKGLRAIHDVGLCHGRPYLKDMTVDEQGNLSWIDLEEDPCARMSLQDAQARDVWLMLSSCTEFCENPLEDLTYLLALYRGDGNTGIDPNLRALGKQLRPFRRMISLLRLQKASKDITGAYWSMRVLEGL